MTKQEKTEYLLEELEALRKEGKLPNNICTEYRGDLVHDFVVHVEMVEPVVDFICRQIKSKPPSPSQQVGTSPSDNQKIRSKL